MSVGESSIAASWYLTYVIIYFIIALPVTAVAKAGFGSHSAFTGVFEKSDTVLVFLMFYFFELTILAYCYMMSAFFSKAKVRDAVCCV